MFEEKDLKKLWDPSTLKTDCRWFRGHVPCIPHKKEGVVCYDCTHYEKLGRRILVIKLGAAGDVIRTTPLLRRIRKETPNAEVVWLTYFPELVPKRWADKVLSFETKNLLWLETQEFDWMINLDKDDEAIALTRKIKAKKISGFLMGPYGKCGPAGDKPTVNKWMTGLWDDLNRANKKNYLEEIFEICGWKFEGETYILPAQTRREWKDIDRTKTVVGLNTGCGARWKTRLWGEKNWTALATLLNDAGYEVVLLGGPQEDEMNRRIQSASRVKYLGHYDFNTFIDLMDQCAVIVSQVTMAMHIAVGLGKQLLLLNNIFNRHEFHLFGKGAIVEPDLKCLGCFKQNFDANCPVANCMELILPQNVAAKMKELRA